ncbi:transforming growth factor-beta receptor-associated protein 1-like [Acropora muricata]|uniref:transforming growth factor-beta receptor-associated protein 1-like n=1 Tax=Acropora muricata TaxID=159855 RepID=UPI0034E44A27
MAEFFNFGGLANYDSQPKAGFKAFEIAPVIERIVTTSADRPKMIECIDCAAQNLYIGTFDCFVLHYVIDEGVSPLGKTTFQSGLQSSKHLGMKKPIQQVLTAPAINRLLILCDGGILMFTMFGLEFLATGSRFKGVTAICRNDNPNAFDPFAVEVCMAISKKKAIHVLSVTEDRIIPLKEISLPEPPLHMAVDGSAVGVALANQYRYCMVNLLSGQIQELFHYEAEITKGLVVGVGIEEFLLNGPTDVMGMFVTSEGTSQRAPLSWSERVLALGYSFPYVIALGASSITVHSIIGQDQKSQKQSIAFKGGKCLLNYDKQVFVCSPREVYCLVQLPFKQQVQMLLNEKRVDEALQLAHVAMETLSGTERDEKLLSTTQQKAGLIYLAESYFTEAGSLMREGRLDPRELIILFPRLLSSNWKYLPSRELVELSSLVKGTKQFLAKIEEFLMHYLEETRNNADDLAYKEEVDTALVKLHIEMNSSSLQDLVSSENSCSVQDTVTWLQKYERHHSLALFYCYHNQPAQALAVWKRIIQGEIPDSNFPGMEYVVNFLSSSGDSDLIWNHVPWLMEKNQEIAVKIFTSRSHETFIDEKMKPDLIVEYLQRFPVALQLFLEHLVYDRKLEKEKYHTHLALLSLEQVLKMKRKPSSSLESINNQRAKLRHILEWSSLYRVTLLLSKINDDSDLDAEAAILYGKMEQHGKALMILVYKLGDFSEAERFCELHSKGKERNFRVKLFQTLLEVYLKPEGDCEPFVGPAVALLNSHMGDFDTTEVLKLIPNEWSIGLISQFLSGSVRLSLHKSRTTKILSGLAREENLKIKTSHMISHKSRLLVTDERLCQACRRPFNDPAVARYPNGVTTHLHCARNKNVCPVTGHVFSIVDHRTESPKDE